MRRHPEIGYYLAWLLVFSQFLMLLIYARKVARYKKSKKVKGEVIDCEFKNHNHYEYKNDHRVYQAIIKVKYDFSGRTWESDRCILRMSWLFNSSAGQDFDFEYKLKQKYKVGDEVVLKVNDSHPDQPLLELAPFSNRYLIGFYLIVAALSVATYFFIY